MDATRLEEMIEKLRRGRPLVKCRSCGERGTWGADLLCNGCAVAERVRVENEWPKTQALRAAKVPERYRQDYAWLAGEWACDAVVYPTGRPLREWGESTAWSALLSGVVGSGKTVIAAELLYRRWRQGFRPALGGETNETPLPMWIEERSLALEDVRAGYGDQRPIREAALRSPVLVWDELGASERWGLVAEICEHRYGRERPTVFTTHRPVTKAKAAAVGRPGESIEEKAPEVYSRLREGWIATYMTETWRGTADAVPA